MYLIFLIDIQNISTLFYKFLQTKQFNLERTKIPYI